MEESTFKEISRLKQGDHSILIYNNTYEVADTLIPFLEIGLKRNERCLVLQDEYSRVQLMPRLANAGINLEDEKRLGRLKFIDSQAAYMKDGVFYIKKMIDFWESTLDNTLKAGYTALRVAGEANWAVKVPRNLKRFLAYEEELRDLFAGSNILVLCMYYKHLFSQEILRKALDLHPLIIHGEKLHNNVFFKGCSFVQRELLEYSDLDGYIHVLTNYSQLEKENEELNRIIRNLHELTIKMATLEENKRKRLAEILHDDICQNLAAIKMAFSNCMKGCQPESEEKKKIAFTVYSMLEDVINATRSITSELYTPNHEEMGIINGITWYVKSVMEPSGMKVILNISKDIENLTDKLKDGVFRIIRECFQNVLKHASASKVEVTCAGDDRKRLKLAIKDDGVGFSYKGIEIEKERGIGLMLMRERVKSLSGSMKIRSHPGKGTEVFVELPLTFKKQTKSANLTSRKPGGSRRGRVSP